MKLGDRKNYYDEDGNLKNKIQILRKIAGQIHSIYPDMASDEELLDLYFLMFSEEQKFENETEKFLFENDKKLWLVWKNSNKQLSIGDRLVFLQGIGTTFIVEVTEICPGDDAIVLQESIPDSEYDTGYEDEDIFVKEEPRQFVENLSTWKRSYYKLN